MIAGARQSLLKTHGLYRGFFATMPAPALRVAKIRTFAPLLVPLRCAGTIALLSDFCSAGWRLPPPVLSRLARTRHPVPVCFGASLFNASIRVDIFTPSPFVSGQQHRSVSPQNAKFFSVMRKKRANRLRASAFYAIITKQTRYALMVKRLRRRPLTAESGVRFPMRVPIKKHRMLGVF